jgi:hypothetical protein
MNVVTVKVGKSFSQKNPEGTNLSSSNYIQQTISQRASIFSDGYRDIDGVYRIAITYPIIKRITHDFMDILVASVSTKDFFARYGNIYHIQSRYIAALDKNANQLAHGNQDLIGRNFFDDFTQRFILYNTDLNAVMHKVLSGEPSFAVYTIGAGERLTTGHPIFVQGEPVMLYLL